MPLLPRLTLRQLLYLLTAAMALPAMALMAYVIHQQYQRDVEQAEAQALQLSRLTADNVSTFVQDARQVLVTLARRQEMLGRECDPIFKNFKEFYPQLSNMSRSTPEGVLDCSSLPQPDNRPTPVSHQEWYQQVYQRQEFVVGPIVFGPVNRNWIVVLAEPLRDASGKMAGALQTPIDLLRLRLIPAADKLDPSIVLGIIDTRGNIIARSRDAAEHVGKNLRGQIPIVDIAIAQREGVARSTGIDGVLKAYGMTPVPGTDWIVVAGQDMTKILAEARQSALSSAAAGSVILLLVLFAALLLSRRIAQPILAMRDTAQSVRSGELGARALVQGPLEVREVAQQFNAMLDTIGEDKAELFESRRRLQLALEGSRLAIWELDVDSGEVLLSATWGELIGGPARPYQLPALELLQRVPKAQRTRLRLIYLELLRGKRASFKVEHQVYNERDEPIWLQTQGQVTERDKSGRARRMLGLNRDVSERRQREDDIQKLAYFDPLTGLPNRRQLAQQLSKAIYNCHRTGLLGALMFVDLDRFKSINDARGHAVGDALLVTVAERLNAMTREGDTVARMGGDEFVVLLTGLPGQPELAARNAMTVADKARQALEQPYELGSRAFLTSASIGVAMIEPGEITADDVLRQADTAMYRAKAGGRNQIAFFEAQMQHDVESRLDFEQDLARAIERNELSLHLQPQVDMQGSTVGAELLMRWHHPQRGSVPPAQFIAVAEETGLIVPLGQWALQQACQMLAQLQGVGLTWPLSLNVSPRQFHQPDFVARVRDALRDSGAPAERLILEVTEGLLLDRLETTIGRMHELNALGIRFSIDDFGTGYSSLAYLKRLPLYELKIDRSFVRDTPGNRDDAEIVQMIISLAHQLRLRVVAEGVETAEQAAFLATCKCDAMQGYLHGRPEPLAYWQKRWRQVSAAAPSP